MLESISEHVRVDIADAERYKAYTTANASPLAKYGARFLVRAGKFEAPEGAGDDVPTSGRADVSTRDRAGTGVPGEATSAPPTGWR